MKNRRLLGAAGSLLLAAFAGLACHLPSGLDALGFACANASDCGGSASLVCVARVCAVAGDGGSAGLPPDLSYPVRVVAYELGYPHAWRDGAAFHPALGQYSTQDPATLSAHLAGLHYAKVDVAMVTWWGSGRASDVAFNWVLDHVNGDPMRWAIQYLGDPAAPLAEKNAGFLLNDINSKFREDPSYWHIGGKNVVYVRSAASQDPCDVASRYVLGNQSQHGNAYLIVRTRAGSPPTCAQNPDAWLMDDASKGSQRTDRIVNVSPGAQTVAGGSTLARNLVRFAEDLRSGLDGGTQLQWITSFNDWGAGTAVEPATEWASDSGFGKYLDALHDAPIR